MTRHTARILVQATAEYTAAAGGVQLQLALGGVNLGAALIRQAEWTRDPVLQTKLLCRELELLRGAEARELLESARRAVAHAFAGSEAPGAQTQPQPAVPPAAVQPTDSARLRACAAPLRQLLLRADLTRGCLCLPDARFAVDARLWVQLSELRGLGLLAPDRRTLTKAGVAAAAALQAARARADELVAHGLPFAAYRAGGGALLAEWSTDMVAGGAVYGDERFIARGAAPSAARRDSQLPDLGRRWLEAVAPAQRLVMPVAFSGTDGVRLVWFSDGSAVAADVFDHVTGGRLDLSFTTGAGSALNVYQFGERVAVIEPQHDEVPAGVRLLLDSAPGGAGHCGQGTLPFGRELALATGLLLTSAAPSGAYAPESALAREFGFSQGDMAAIHDDVAGLLAALAAGDEVGAQVTAFGDTKLMLAVEAQRFQMALNLWRLGARAEARNHRRRTALMSGACVGSVDLICLIGLLLAGLPPAEGLDAQDEEGNTAMHWAAREGHRLAIDCLRWLGARTDLRNNEGRTPEEEAREYEHPTTAAACRARKITEPKFSSVEVKEVLRLVRAQRIERLDLRQAGGAALAARRAPQTSSGACADERRNAA